MTTLEDLLDAIHKDHFTDRNEICDIFCKLIQTPAQLRLYRILVIHGPGGIGKSVLMRRFRNLCDENKIHSSIANMDNVNSPLELLTALRENWDTPPNGRQFRDFDELLDKFHDLHVQLQRQDAADGRISEAIGRITGEVSAAVVGSVISGLALGPVGTLIGAAGGALAGNVLDSSLTALRKNGLISRKEADFLTSLLANLVAAFFKGANEIAGDSQCVVIILDTYEYAEQFTSLNDWITTYLLPKLPEEMLAVVAGRNEARGRFWQNYSSFVLQHKLKPFEKSDIVDYLNARRISPDKSDSLFEWTAGLPLGAALWADIETQKQMGFSAPASPHSSVEVVRAVVDRLLEDLDDGSKQAIRICAIPRLFDEPLLNLLLPKSDVHLVYESLQRYSSLFRSRSGGLAMHDEARPFMLEDFRSRNIELYNTLNLRLAEYYEQKVKLSTPHGRKWFENRTEQIYHLLATDNHNSFLLLNSIIDDACMMSDLVALESLLRMINDLPPDRGHDWAVFICGEISNYHHEYEEAKNYFLDALKLPFPPIIEARILISLSHALWNTGQYREALAYGLRAKKLCEEIGDRIGLVRLCNCLGWIYHELGDYQESIHVREIGHAIANELQSKPDLAWALNGLGTTYLCCGDSSRAWELLQQSLTIWSEIGHDFGKTYTLLHLGMVQLAAGNLDPAITYYETALQSAPEHNDQVQVWTELGLAYVLQGDSEKAEGLLQECRNYAQTTGKTVCEARATLLLGHAALQSGDWAAAEPLFAQAAEISAGIEAKGVYADALHSTLQSLYQRSASTADILTAAGALEDAARTGSLHYLLAQAGLYRGLALLRVLSTAEMPDNRRDEEGHHVAGAILQALTSALKFNSYILDQVLVQFLTATASCNQAIVAPILSEISSGWQSSTLDGQVLSDVEAALRRRDLLFEQRSPLRFTIGETLMASTTTLSQALWRPQA